MNIKNRFGNRLKSVRKKKKMTQLELATTSGIERTFISHIEAGNRNVSIETMDKLFEGLSIDFTQFFNVKF